MKELAVGRSVEGSDVSSAEFNGSDRAPERLLLVVLGGVVCALRGQWR